MMRWYRKARARSKKVHDVGGTLCVDELARCVLHAYLHFCNYRARVRPARSNAGPGIVLTCAHVSHKSRTRGHTYIKRTHARTRTKLLVTWARVCEFRVPEAAFSSLTLMQRSRG